MEEITYELHLKWILLGEIRPTEQEVIQVELLSGSQVNLETQNIVVEYRPAPTWAVNIGLQRLYDTPHDTYRTALDKMVNTGYRLNYWGTNGAGFR